MSDTKTIVKNIDNQDKKPVVKKRKSGPWRDVWRRLKKNKMAMFGLFIILLLIFAAIFADFIAPYGFDDQNLKDKLMTPGSKYLLGADNFGRDILSRIIYGSSIS